MTRQLTPDGVADLLAPRGESIDAVLVFLLEEARAQHAALVAFAGQGQDLALIACAGALQIDAITKVRDLWNEHEPTLRLGRIHRTGSYALAPVMDQRTVVGLLYAAESCALDAATLELVRPHLLRRIQGAMRSEPLYAERYIASISTEELERIQLAAALKHQNGCIARVANVLGKTRKTVYRQMERFGLSHSPRGRKARRAIKPEESPA